MFEIVIHFCVGLVGLQAAVMEPQICKGIVLINISLRMLHIKKQPWFGRPLIRSFQNLLRYMLGLDVAHILYSYSLFKGLIYSCFVLGILLWENIFLKPLLLLIL